MQVIEGNISNKDISKGLSFRKYDILPDGKRIFFIPATKKDLPNPVREGISSLIEEETQRTETELSNIRVELAELPDNKTRRARKADVISPHGVVQTNAGEILSAAENRYRGQVVVAYKKEGIKNRVIGFVGVFTHPDNKRVAMKYEAVTTEEPYRDSSEQLIKKLERKNKYNRKLSHK